MKYLICALALTLAACKSTPAPTPGPVPVPVTCGPVTSDIASALATGLAQLDTCSNPAAIEQSLLSVLPSAICAFLPVPAQVSMKKLQVRKVSYKGIVGNLVCPLAVASVQGLLNNNVAPAAWGCTGNSDVSAGLTAACEAIVPY